MARIGVVTTSYPRHVGDHAGSFVGAHVRALEALGHDVDVVAAGIAAAEPGVTRVPGALFYEGGAPEALERRGWHAAPEAAAFTVRLAQTIARRSRERAWSAAIAHWLVPSALAAAAALPAGVPLLAIGHGGDIHTLRRTRLLGPVLRALRLRGAKLAVVSHELRALCAPCMDAVVQPMGIDAAHFAALGRAPTTPPTVAFIGRLVPVKGTDVLVEAMRLITRSARVVIAGEGPERTGLTNDLIARPLRHPLDIRGPVSAAERDQILREASVILVPSRVLPNGRTEGTPLVALEALAAGVPVIGSAVGGLVDLPIALVPPGDPRALAQAIDHVLARVPASPPPGTVMAAYDWAHVAGKLLP